MGLDRGVKWLGWRHLNRVSQWNYFCRLLTNEDTKWLWRGGHRVEQSKWKNIQVKEKNTIEMAEKSEVCLYSTGGGWGGCSRLRLSLEYCFTYITVILAPRWGSSINLAKLKPSTNATAIQGRRNVTKGTSCAFLSGWNPAHGFPNHDVNRLKKKKRENEGKKYYRRENVWKWECLVFKR